MVVFALRRIGVTIATVVASVIILCLLWQLALVLLHANPLISRTPLGVFDYLFGAHQTTTTTAAQHRAQLIGWMWTTLWHAAWGFVIGVLASMAIAVAFTLVPVVEFMFMPIAMLLRVVPLLAMAPVIYLVFGNGLVTASLVGTVVVFFPLLVNLTLGYRSVSAQQTDVIRVYGGSSWTVWRKVSFPHALPHFFASLRIAVPGAITGAMLYEWLFTFEGLGAGINTAKSHFDYGGIWAIVVFVTGLSIVGYTIASIIETIVLAEWGPDAGRAGAR
ncbi:ABC transporter permease [Gryllotalpicola protaetiae]|nr:ABC transporter permease subunit [Gryllotalpicola protaetiae]